MRSQDGVAATSLPTSIPRDFGGKPAAESLAERLGIRLAYTRTGLDGSLHLTTTLSGLIALAEDAGVVVEKRADLFTVRRGIGGRLAIITEVP